MSVMKQCDELMMLTHSSLMLEFLTLREAGVNHTQRGWPQKTYSVSKVGVSAHTPVLQRKIDRQRPGEDIVVNSVHPGHVRTSMNPTGRK